MQARGGLGIGLALARRLVENDGGRVEARSEGAGRGSKFIVHLPLAKKRGLEPREAGAIEPGAVVPARQILVVMIIRTSPRAGECRWRRWVRRFAWPTVGVRAGNRHCLYPDVVLLDLGMPGMDGYETALRLRGLPGDRSFVLVALTGRGQEEDLRRTREAGFDRHLTKPVDLSLLQGVLKGSGDGER